jgi:hypothetical protein
MVKNLLKLSVFQLSVLAMTALCACSASLLAQSEIPKAITLDTLMDEYGSYSNYQDKGTLDVVYYESGVIAKRSSVNFETNYNKFGDFDITWSRSVGGGYKLSYKIWNTNGDTYSKYGNDASFQSASLYDALARAAGISNSITFYMPCLLMPSMKCFICNESVKFSVNYVADLDPELQRIDIQYQSGRSESLWVEKRTKQLLRVEWWNESGDLRVHHRISYTSIEAQ